MIRLHGDALWFETREGELVPCSVETMAFEIVDGTGEALDAELIRNAAKAVLHYFREDLGRTQVTVADFARVFAAVLRGFGLNVEAAEEPPITDRVTGSDLSRLAVDSGEGFELMFFARLRAELRRAVAESSGIIQFRGLRECAKALTGAQRWNPRCQRLSDQIVSYLRDCLSSEPGVARRPLVIR